MSDQAFLPSVPVSLESECAVLGGLLLSPEAFDRVADVVQARDFYRDAHRIAFQAIADMVEDGSVSIDVVTVFERLQANGTDQRVGGLGYLGEIANNTPSAANIRRYAEIVRDKAQLREMMAMGQRIIESAVVQDGATVADKIASAVQLASSMAEGVVRGKRAVTMKDALADSLDAIQAHYDGEAPETITTGLPTLDAKLVDFVPGNVVVIAGRPGMGKTSLAVQIAEHVATPIPGDGNTVMIFSMEMPQRQLTHRIISMRAKIPLQRLSGKLLDEDFEKLTFAAQQLSDKKIFIDDQGELSVTQIRAKAQAIQRKHGLKLMVVDYLQLMPGEGNNRNEELSSITRKLKGIAKQLGCLVIVLSQLSRKVEERPNKRPLMSDLRESGAIEQDADVIIMCYRDEYYHADSPDKGTAELILSKQRNGATGEVRVAWRGEYATFETLDYQAWAAQRAQSVPMQTSKRRGGFS